MKRVLQVLGVSFLLGGAIMVYAAAVQPTATTTWVPQITLNNFTAGEVEATTSHFKLTLSRSGGPYQYNMVLDMQQDGNGAVTVHRYCEGSEVMCSSIAGRKECIRDGWTPWCFYNPVD